MDSRMMFQQAEVIRMDFELTVIFTVAEVYCDETILARVKKLRIEALMRLLYMLRYYRGLGYMDFLIEAIAEKKCQMIKEANTKDDIRKFLEPRCPKHDGNRFVEDPCIVPEEELICWSMASLRAPLNSTGSARFKELFDRIFPNGMEGGTQND